YIGEVVNSEGAVTKIVHDLSKSWWQILTLILAAGVCAFLWTVVLRVLGGFMIWTSILCIIAVLGAAIIVSVALLIVLLVLLFVRKRISIAVALIEESSK
ncbi:hypothetical protein TELCIR_22007, partial [Teladorsagia circumcincta]